MTIVPLRGWDRCPWARRYCIASSAASHLHTRSEVANCRVLCLELATSPTRVYTQVCRAADEATSGRLVGGGVRNDYLGVWRFTGMSIRIELPLNRLVLLWSLSASNCRRPAHGRFEPVASVRFGSIEWPVPAKAAC